MLDTNLSSNELSEPSSEHEESLRLPWPDWFPPVYVHSPYGFSNHNAGTYHKDPDVRIAKNSTPPEHKLQEALAASDRIMETYLREESLKGIAANLCGQTTYVVSPVKPSYPSGNVLARAFAEAVANELGLKMASGVYQNPRMKRDKKTDFFVRLSHPTEFFADPSKNIEDVIIPGADYIIADDVLTYGGTLAGLRAFIECHGGRVICMTTLAGMPPGWKGRCLKGLSKQQIANYDAYIFGNPPGEFPIAIEATTCSQLQLYKDGVFQGFFEKELGYGINCFTQREAVGILRELKPHQGNFSLDFWRERIVRARGESYGSSSV